jgi:flagellum-specific ATP synthase
VPDEKKARQVVRELLAAYAENEDLITIGAYRRGANRTLDAAVEMRDEINRLLRQQVEERVEIDQVRKDLIALAAKCVARMNMAAAPMPVAAVPQPVAAAAPAKRPTVIKKA